jgi:hypothetical protein
MVAFGEVASWMKNNLSGMDDTGLARWTYMTFLGEMGSSLQQWLATTHVKQPQMQLEHAITSIDTTFPPKGNITHAPDSFFTSISSHN